MVTVTAISLPRRQKRALAASLAAAILMVIWVASPTRAAEPILQLDTGGHMALVRSIVFTPDGRHLISSSDDKVIRIWDRRSGRTVRTLRGQIEEGNAGKIYALALSPDGRWLAAGGRLNEDGRGGHPIRLYDLKSGKIARLLKGHEGAVLSLEFSPSGKHLISSGTDDIAILWDPQRGTPVARLEGHAGDVNRARFTRDGRRVVTASDDKMLALWSLSDGRLIKRMKGHSQVVVALAVSPRNGVIASGGLDKQILLWDGATGRLLGRFADQGTEVMNLSFAPDGHTLLSGVGAKPYHAILWDVETGRKRMTYRGHDNIVLATAISPDGRFAATGGGNDNEIHLWDRATGRRRQVLRGVGRAAWAVGFSRDGQYIAWGATKRPRSLNDQGPLAFSLRLPLGERSTGTPRPIETGRQAFHRARTQLGRRRLTHRAGGKWGYLSHLDLIEDGRTLATVVRDEKTGYAHNAYSFTLDGRTIISGGGHGWLTAFDANGRKLGDFVGHTGDIWALAVSPDGRMLLSGSDDQTVRLWNIATRKTIAALFHGSNGEWVLWTPQGYFSASPDGDTHVGWHINEGADKAGRFVTAAQLKRHFYRPDIVRRALLLRNADRAVREAARTRFALGDLIRRKPPQFTIAGYRSGATVGASQAQLTVRVTPGPDPIEGFDIDVNGRRIGSGSRGVEQHAGEHRFTIPLASGENRIRITGVNAVGRTVRTITLLRRGTDGDGKRGTLYVVTIGVDIYGKFKGQDLRFAGADARAIHQALIAKAGPLHTEVRSLVVVRDGDEPPTAENIKRALKLFEKAGPQDTVVLFLAGHGINDGADYLFLPTDAETVDEKWKPDSVVNWRVLQHALQTTRGRRIMLVDTCYAGNAFNERLIKDAADASIVIFAATDADTLAQERLGLGHGVFTHAMLEGLKGKADLEPDRLVKVRELSRFVTDSVKSITKGEQLPVFHLSGTKDFIFSRF